MASTFLGRLSPSERERLLSSLSPDVSAAVVAHLKHLSMTPDHQSEATRFDVTSDASDASDAPNAPPPLPLPREPPCSTDPVDAVSELYRQMAEPTPPVQPARVPPAPSAVLDPLAPPVSRELPISRPAPRRLAPAQPGPLAPTDQQRPTDRHPRRAVDAGCAAGEAVGPGAGSSPPVPSCTPRQEPAALAHAPAMGPPHARLLSQVRARVRVRVRVRV